jgi:MYXO-CTERM domain-containing protein
VTGASRTARASGRARLALVLAAALPALGCGGEEWEPSGVGPPVDSEVGALLDPTAGSHLKGDMVEPEGDVETRRGALGDGSQAAGEPKVVYLMYADGKTAPPSEVNACKGVAPKFTCSFAPTLAECQRQIQAYLDKWYADFNVVFTLTKPVSGRYYTEVISSGGGAWCDVSPKVAGVAPFLCKDLNGGVAYTFLGGGSAKQTAIIIAQEQAHLVGLEHTTSTHDLLYPSICTDCDGFRDEELPIDGDRCDRPSQNSYEMMKDRLGAWPGGTKPSAFGCMNDLLPPTVKILEPKDGGEVKKNFSLRVDAKDDCNLASVQVQVMPQSLKAESFMPPFEWDLTNISGQQTITITAIDGFGHITKESVTIKAPMAKDENKPAGCDVASGAYGLAGFVPALGVLMVFSTRRRRPARR